MPDDLTELQRQYVLLLGSIPFIQESLDYSILDKHKPWLEEMHVSNTTEAVQMASRMGILV